MNLEDILGLIIKDLKLDALASAEFKNQFMELLIYNLLLKLPFKVRSEATEIIDSSGKNQDELNNLIKTISTKLNLNPDEAKNIIDNSLRQSITEVVAQYPDLLAEETKVKLQNYTGVI